MFDFVYRHRKRIQLVILLLIVPPFALFGVDIYFRNREGVQSVARVGDYTISQDEFSRALRERQSALQQQTGGRIDPALLDNPELRAAALDTLVRRRLLVARAQEAGLAVTDEDLRRAINEAPAFRDETGKFDFKQYQDFLRSQGLTPSVFEARLRQDIMIRQLAGAYADSGFVPRTVAAMLEKLAGQSREVSEATLKPEAFLPQAKLSPDAAKAYYNANTPEFRVPEQARVEYVVLSIDSLAQAIQFSPDDVKKLYESNRAHYTTAETRDAAHILVTADPGAGAAGKEKARARAQEIYREVEKNPAGFAEAARKYSADPGSAQQGGSLGRIPRGTMKDVPEFEKALYALQKPGDISAPVETKLGFHIIRVVAIHPEQVKPLEEVRGEIEKELRRQQASRRFAEIADGFSNIVYEQSDSLKPAAELAKSEVRQSGWLSRESAPPPLNNPKLLAAVFSADVLKDKRNSEAVEVAPGTLVAARVIESKPASTQPFEEVRGALEKRLALREASKLAVAEGRRRLDELRQGKAVAMEWSAPLVISREDPKGASQQVLRQTFKADVSKLPAYAGIEAGGGAYTIVRVSRVEQQKELAPGKAKELIDQIQALYAQEMLAAYVASLRQKAGVTINKEELERKQP